MNASGIVGSGSPGEAIDPDLHLPLTVLLRYLFFLSRRPISSSNRSFLIERVSGLRALAALIDERSGPRLGGIATAVRRLTPDTIADVTREVSQRLTPLVAPNVADDVIVTDRPPDRDVLAACRRIRLILGPGIGIGDEALCLSLPAWLRTAASDAEIHVLSTRPALWSSASAVESVERYADFVAFVEAVRDDASDLVFLADFERPGLTASLSRGQAPPRYVELSIGARTLEVFDSGVRCVHRLVRPSPYCANYYELAAYALRWLGTTASLRDRGWPIEMPRSASNPDQPHTVVVSPFTSKYEPSEAAWSALVAALFTAAGAGTVRLVFDPGPSLVTERFASALAASARASVATGIACEVASEAPARTLTLAGVLGLIQGADVVVCADTFATHVAPLSGCLTLVVASQSLTNWRVPHAPVFYFDDEDAPSVIARGMRRVLAAFSARLANGWLARPWCTPAGRRLVAATVDLSDAVSVPPAARTGLLGAYEACSTLLREVVSELPDWPEDFRPLVTDRAYHRLLPPLRPAARMSDRPGWDDDLRAHLAHLLGVWENSNLHKYLRLAARPQTR
jgi:hypothetical protein